MSCLITKITVNQCVSIKPCVFPLVFPSQYWRRVCSYGGGRGHVQGLCRPAQEREGPGRGGAPHTPEARDQTRDLVGPDHQLIEMIVVRAEHHGSKAGESWSVQRTSEEFSRLTGTGTLRERLETDSKCKYTTHRFLLHCWRSQCQFTVLFLFSAQ